MDADSAHPSARAAHFDGIELPATPPPPNGSRLPTATLPDSTTTTTSDDETSDGASAPLNPKPHASKRPIRFEEESLVAAEARAWAAEQRALAAEGALEGAWARAAEAEAHATAAQRSADSHAARANDLASQLAAALAASTASAPGGGLPAVAQSAGAAAEAPISSAEAGALAGAEERCDRESVEAVEMEVWSPLGLGSGLSWAAEVDDAEKLRSLDELQVRFSIRIQGFMMVLGGVRIRVKSRQG